MTPLSLGLNGQLDVRGFPYDETWFGSQFTFIQQRRGFGWCPAACVLMRLPSTLALYTPHQPVLEPKLMQAGG
jgi:hypothetical protein